ncbi:hypothetical protein DFH08DRAFT_801926 [Mycena albidolilacea]|uniref:Uncharacterized protein n=1 Tax=Mycena albidolilacea TaxID=1033008 RepID=A0AAD7F005_9AGAR|nr:hypothetical protein DFH08DRAFT_801926 [Mycena albidolilacea]
MADDSVYELSSSESDDSVADDDVDGMIKKMVENNPQFNKFMELMKQKENNQKAKERRLEKKKCKAAEKADDDDSAPTPKWAKNGKAKAELEDDSDPPTELTGYIHVLKPLPALPPLKSCSMKSKPEIPYISRGPFNFDSNCSFDLFVTILATSLPCAPSHIVLEKTEWKLQTPANHPPLPLGSEIGFKVLLEQICTSCDKIVIISMPGPRKPAADAPFWDTNDDNDGNKAEAGPSDGVFDYTELKARTTEESVNEQKMSFDRSVAPYVEELKERWPENGAGKQIYMDELGYQWELNTIWLSIWVSHIAWKTATLDKAPLSSQFDINLLLPILHQQQQHQFAPQAVPHVPQIPNKSPIPSALPSPVKLNHRYVSLVEFCDHYAISQHFDHLQRLEYKPGDHEIVGLGCDDWQEFAGISKLAWNKVLLMHKQFLTDICVACENHALAFSGVIQPVDSSRMRMGSVAA